MACAGVHRASASTVRVRRPPSLPGVVGCFVANTTNGKFPLTVLAAVHSGFLRTKLRKRAHALAERSAVQHSDLFVVASRPHCAPHAGGVGVRLARGSSRLSAFSGPDFHVAKNPLTIELSNALRRGTPGGPNQGRFFRTRGLPVGPEVGLAKCGI